MAEVTVTGVSTTTTFTATYSNATATCTVTVGPSYIFYDDCTTDLTSQYTSSVLIGSSATPSLSFNSTETAYQQSASTIQDGDHLGGWAIPNSRGADGVKVSIKVNLPSTSPYTQLMVGVTDSLSQSTSGTFDLYRIRADNKADFLHNSDREVSGSSKSTSVRNTYVTMVFQRNGNSLTCSTYNSSNTLLSTYSYTTANSYTNPYYVFLSNASPSATASYIKEIKVEYI